MKIKVFLPTTVAEKEEGTKEEDQEEKQEKEKEEEKGGEREIELDIFVI